MSQISIIRAVVDTIFGDVPTDDLPPEELIFQLFYNSGTIEDGRAQIEKGLQIHPLDPAGLSEKTLRELESKGFRFIGRCN